jgi:hypothetical protein
MVEVVNLAEAGEIVLAVMDGRITEIGAIGALVQGGRTVRQARELLSIVSVGRPPRCRLLSAEEKRRVWAPIESNSLWNAPVSESLGDVARALAPHFCVPPKKVI